MSLFPDIVSSAKFSDCGKYRYWLRRAWDGRLPDALCIGLNPSTANATDNDATIRILISCLKKLGYGGFYMMNLFAIISSKPEILLTCEDPLGENDFHLNDVSLVCKDVIVCWGAFKQAEARIKEVLPKFPDALCFGFNKNGTPFHPRALNYIKGGLDAPTLTKYSTGKP